MGGIGWVAVAALAFVGSHFVLSHPLREPLVRRLGAGGFSALYAVVAALTLGWLVVAYRGTPAEGPLWAVGDGLWAVATIVMLLASILLLGSLIRNPALPSGPTPAVVPETARGVFTVTRHPMMWSFALWGASHILIYPEPANIVLCIAIIVLALAGSALQDRKKEALQPGWRDWESRTSFWPFAAVAAGRTTLGGFKPHDIIGGIVVWLASTWAHIPLAGWAAGIWRWVPADWRF